MSRLGNCEPVDVYACCEPFVMSLYTISINKIAVGNVNDLRYWLFCQKRHKNEKLPPTQDSLSLHGKRAHYQAMVWRKALESRQNLPPPTGNGWEVKDGILQPVLITKDPAPTGLVDLTVCHCKTSRLLLPGRRPCLHRILYLHGYWRLSKPQQRDGGLRGWGREWGWGCGGINAQDVELVAFPVHSNTC